MRIRNYWHIGLGALLPWLPAPVGIPLVLLFLGYEYLQYGYLSNRALKDDSYLDIYEVTVACGISSVLSLIIPYIL